MRETSMFRGIASGGPGGKILINQKLIPCQNKEKKGQR